MPEVIYGFVRYARPESDLPRVDNHCPYNLERMFFALVSIAALSPLLNRASVVRNCQIRESFRQSDAFVACCQMFEGLVQIRILQAFVKFHPESRDFHNFGSHILTADGM